MKSSLILATIGMAAALDVHHDQSYAQVGTQAGQAAAGTLAYCSEKFYDIQECLDSFGTALTPALLFADWADQVTFGQAYCWLKYSEAYGFTTVESWGNDPTVEDHHAFLMPNTREYEHFYNDPDCNQQFRMGRGREQPDAVTFGYVPPHDHNRLIMTNQVAVTPWISHDEMVLQFFGITDQCVQIRPDAIGAKKGLVDGQFRIEYKVAGATVTIDGADFGLSGDLVSDATATANDNPLSTPVVPVGTTAGDSGLFEAEVCVCRTPHYLAICTDTDTVPCDTGCTANCEYHAAFTSFDATAPIDSAANLAVPCHQGSVFTFDGLGPQADFGTYTNRVKTLTFADKCEADSFVMLHGTHQQIILEGDLAGPLEIIIGNDDTDDADVIFTFKKHNTGTLADQTVTVDYEALTDVFGDHNDNMNAGSPPIDQNRLFVYAKHGRYDICTDCSGVKVCLSDPAVSMSTTDQNGAAPGADPLFGQQFYFGTGVDAIAGTTFLLADEDYVNTGLGDDTVTGSTSFNIIEDHGGKDTVSMYAGSDNILISRSGGDTYSSAATVGANPSEVNEYWIYPTHEHGNHYFGAKNPDDTLQCTIIDTLKQHDTIYLRMDDPTASLHKFSNDDDLCSVAVSGWELAFYMDAFAGVTFDSSDATTEQTIHVWFSRDDGKADICLGTAADSCAENTDDTNCITYWVLCPDKNPWLDEPIHDYEDLLINLDWFGWW